MRHSPKAFIPTPLVASGELPGSLQPSWLTRTLYLSARRLLVLVCLGLVCLSLPAGAAGVSRGGSRESLPALRDERVCLGCHDGGLATGGIEAGNGAAPGVNAAEIRSSVHSTLVCMDCHTDIRDVPHERDLASVDCARCHEPPVPAVAEGRGAAAPTISRHRGVAAAGTTALPGCTDCHGSHATLRAMGVSRLGGGGMVGRCSGCHPGQAGEYRESVHGRALAQRNEDVPTCASCHPEHPGSGEGHYPGGGVVETCVSCHEDPGLQERYAIPGNRLASYLGSYHGAASQLGDTRVADCASCHGEHLILASADPRSSVHPANLSDTCGECHPGAGQHFAESKIHLEPSLHQDTVVFVVRLGYQLFVAGLMSAFLGYIFLDVLARIRKRFEPSQRPRRGEREPEYERLTLNQRVQHWVLIASFVTLLATGLPLFSPASPISQGMVRLLGGMGARAAVHRAAAVALIGICAYHLLYVLFSRKGHRELRELIPGLKDARDIIQMMKWYLGLGQRRPRFGRYNFIEKFEYLAVGWGSVVMIATGALLWAPHISLMLVPKWVMDVAFVIHSWEAILAFLAIIIWHMYNVHYDPSVFPMSKVWLTGRIGLHEFREKHPLEYEGRFGQTSSEPEL